MLKNGPNLMICLFFLFASSNAMARSPLPHITDARLISPVCVVSGLPETAIHDLQQTLCIEASRLLKDRHFAVEVLALNDPRMSSPERLVLGLRAHVETLDGIGSILTLNGQISGDQRRVPTAAHSAPFDSAHSEITPAASELLRKVLKEQGLL